jgi:hypothetical protein
LADPLSPFQVQAKNTGGDTLSGSTGEQALILTTGLQQTIVEPRQLANSLIRKTLGIIERKL